MEFSQASPGSSWKPLTLSPLYPVYVPRALSASRVMESEHILAISYSSVEGNNP